MPEPLPFDVPCLDDQIADCERQIAELEDSLESLYNTLDVLQEQKEIAARNGA